MKKILIVDDEYIVRLGLKTIVDWSGFGYTVAGEAANGREALDFLEKNPADVILTDIKMPVMDGLELTRKVREKNLKVRIILLSHYDDFSYAQEAIKLGAFRYILKSELTKASLEAVLKSLHLNSDDPVTHERQESWKEQWEKCIGEYMLPTFTQRIRKQAFPPPPDTSHPAGAAQCPISETGVCVVFSASCRTTSLLNEARVKFPQTVKVLFAEAFGDLAGIGHYYDDNFNFIAIAPAAPPTDHAAIIEQFIAEKIHNPCVQIVKNIRQYYDVNLFIGASSFGKCTEYGRLLREAHDARIGCFFSTKLFVGVFSAKRDTASNTTPEKGGLVSYTKLIELIDANQKEAMMEYIQSIFRELRAGSNYATVHDVFIDFLSAAKLIHGKFQLEEAASLSGDKFKYDAFFDLQFIGDVEMYIYELYLSLLFTKQNGKALYSYIVKSAIDFIHSDYEHNIGLAEAARKAGVSQSYLSFIFKQETGVNFNAALAHYRIEKAKKLLATTNLRIYEVAEQVGFSNPYYFSKIFKEISGFTCKEYRDNGGC
ncbi:MAG: response regulator [Treponema sp.]|jgi:two-component system response regulator YesN|nr:response regulator [Treponema sp.]